MIVVFVLVILAVLVVAYLAIWLLGGLALLVGFAASLIAHPVRTLCLLARWLFATAGGIVFLFLLLVWFGYAHDRPLALVGHTKLNYYLDVFILVAIIVVCAGLSALFAYLAERPSQLELRSMERTARAYEQAAAHGRANAEPVIYAEPELVRVDGGGIKEIVDTTVVDDTVSKDR